MDCNRAALGFASAIPSIRSALTSFGGYDIKDMYVDNGGREMVPFLEVLDGMVKRGIEVRLIHAKDPGPNWRDDFDRAFCADPVRI